MQAICPSIPVAHKGSKLLSTVILTVPCSQVPVDGFCQLRNIGSNISNKFVSSNASSITSTVLQPNRVTKRAFRSAVHSNTRGNNIFPTVRSYQ